MAVVTQVVVVVVVIVDVDSSRQEVSADKIT